MKKEALFLFGILFLIYGCAQVDVEGKAKTAEGRPAEDSYTSTATDHMVSGDYGELERNIDVLLKAGNMIGDKHYGELKSSIDRLEKDGVDVTALREKLAKLNAASEPGEEKKYDSNEDVSHGQNSQIEQKKQLDQGLKSIQNPGYTELIDVSNGIAASLSRDRVISVVNVENPQSPIVKSTIETNAFAETVYKDKDYYYLSDSREFMIFDKIDNNPIGIYDNDFWIVAMTVSQGHGYLVSGDKMIILDVRDPKNIQKISEISLVGRAPSDVIVKDGYAYVVETLGGLNIINVINPSNPKLVKVIPFESHTAGFDTEGDYAYLGRITSTKSDSQGYSQTSAFEVIDISNPALATVVSSIEIPTDIRDLDVNGKYAYVVGSYPYRLSVIDISSAGNPKMLKTEESIAGSSDLQKIIFENGYAFIADGIAGIRIVDVNNPSKPQHIKDFDVQGRAFSLYKNGNELLVGVEKKYFNLADVSNPEEPKQMHSESFTSSYEYTNVVIDSKRLYFNARGARIYDITNPKNPQQLNKAPIEADSIQVQGNYLYSTIGEIGLLVYDLSDLASLSLVSKTPFPSGIPRGLSVDGKWAAGISNSPYSISVFDISNPQNPIAGKSYKYEKYPNSVTVKDGYAYIARGEDGVDIIKVNENGSLELARNIHTNGRYAHYVAVSGNEAFVLKDGADVYDISNPKNPAFLKHINNKGEAVRADVENGHIYFADGYAGVTIARID